MLHLQLAVERTQTSGKPGEGTVGKLSKAPMVGIGLFWGGEGLRK